MRHTISILVENKFGVLSRVSGLFSGRGFNIESLSVAPTLDPEVSKMTIITSGDDKIVEQITKHLNRLVDVIKVQDLTGTNFLDREMVLLKISAGEDKLRAEIHRLVEVFRAKIVDVSPKAYIVEITGDAGKIDAFVRLCKPLGLKDIVRTGRVAMARTSAPGETGL